MPLTEIEKLEPFKSGLPAWYDQWKIVSEENAQLRAEVERIKKARADETPNEIARLRAENELVKTARDNDIENYNNERLKLLTRIAAKDAALEPFAERANEEPYYSLTFARDLCIKAREARKA